jgi:hypothetical protein
MTESAAPIFVLCYARSGSTLVRYVLDAHPQVVCPPELHLLLVAKQLAWVFEHTAAVPAGSKQPPDAKVYAIERVRETVSSIMDEHAARASKPVWAEKSVSSIDHIDLLERLYPHARLICLHRQAPDVMASCAQAAQQNQGVFGFEPFVAASRGNPVDGLADYWVDKTHRLLDTEEKLVDSCLRIRYEDLVNDPQTSLATLFDFLDLPSSAGMLDSIFSTPHVVGPGDNKILTTTGIHANSIGHGERLAMDQLSADRREQIDTLHAQLGYSPIAGAS